MHVGFWFLWIREWSWAPSQKEDRVYEQSISSSENWVSGALPMILRWYWSGCTPGRIQRMPLHGIPRLPLLPTAVFASEHALVDMDLLREPLSAAAHAACEHVRTLESSRVFNRLGAGGHATQQRVFLKYSGICQLIKNMKA